MSQTNVSTPVAAAVFIGSAILIGAPVTYAVVTVVLNAVFFALDVVDVTVGSGPLAAPLFIAAVVLVAWLWMRISYEVAQLRLYGVSALSRGSRVGTLARYLVLWGVILAALGSIAAFGLLWTLALVSSPSPTALAGSVLTVACVWAFARSVRALRDGWAESG
ncbi:hypothetical protein [Halovenus halobia]|uniref:hypothetical protein n=1 Tax=Halovenus halobia TaxID=3396622 RepID=UPI003F56767B